MNKKRVPKNYWNKETMQQYCDENNINYKILDTKIVEKKYQKQLWALVKCPNEKHEAYWVWWNNFLHKYYCKECDYELKGKEFWSKEKAFLFVKEHGYTMCNKEDFKGVDSSFPCFDDKGFVYMLTITNLRNVDKNHQKNFSLFRKNPYAIQNIKNYCKLYKNEYEILSTEFKGVKEKYLFKYNGEFEDGLEHCREFETTIDCFIHGDVKHPLLTRSKGEKKAEIFFRNNNINFIAEKCFDSCKDKQKLPFDFYLPDYNMVVEIMGEQHEKPIDFWGGIDTFNYIKYHDTIKRTYLKDHNIKLLEIWYWDFNNIEEILKSRLLLQSAYFNGKEGGEYGYKEKYTI